MEILVAITIGVLIAAGIYRLLGGSKTDAIIGLILLSQGANLIIFASGGLKHNAAAFVGKGPINAADYADPLPQALVLTAIVIGFGILAFLLTLLIRSSSK
jgi:multisubunit Na+/H+ antiporter MnhC subunit